jgi:hypothetical protein
MRSFYYDNTEWNTHAINAGATANDTHSTSLRGFFLIER